MRDGLILAALVVVAYMVFKAGGNKAGGKDSDIGTGGGIGTVPRDPGRAVAF